MRTETNTRKLSIWPGSQNHPSRRDWGGQSSRPQNFEGEPSVRLDGAGVKRDLRGMAKLSWRGPVRPPQEESRQTGKDAARNDDAFPHQAGGEHERTARAERQ